jgi:predicted nucleic-acid-binding Zn-ribbon protein
MDKSCPKCQNEMIKGRVRDVAHGAIYQERWVPDDNSLWFTDGVKVDTFACKKCGFVESYLQIVKDAETSSA